MITVQNLNYKNILKSINLTIPRGMNYLKGNNGAGKSTLLDCISNVNRDYTGSVYGNHSVLYLNQNLYFSYRLTTSDFVEFVFRLDGIKKEKELFFDYLKTMNLYDLFQSSWKKSLGMLSGGERKVIFFTTLSYLQREWYIFDEPFAGVDSICKEYMMAMIDHLNYKGKGILITSHETEPLHTFEDLNTIVIEKGEIASSE